MSIIDICTKILIVSITLAINVAILGGLYIFYKDFIKKKPKRTRK